MRGGGGEGGGVSGEGDLSNFWVGRCHPNSFDSGLESQYLVHRWMQKVSMKEGAQKL